MRYQRRDGNVDGIGDFMRSGLISMLEWIKKEYEKDSKNIKDCEAVEIGTYFGESAAILSDYFGFVTTIDPWNLDFVSMCATEIVTEETLQKEYGKNTSGRNITQIRMPSVAAARKFPDGNVDFVYIDGWHRGLPMFADLITWLPKVKMGGFIGGHDYKEDGKSAVKAVVKSVLGDPDFVFPDSSWIKRV